MQKLEACLAPPCHLQLRRPHHNLNADTWRRKQERPDQPRHERQRDQVLNKWTIKAAANTGLPRQLAMTLLYATPSERDQQQRLWGVERRQLQPVLVSCLAGNLLRQCTDRRWRVRAHLGHEHKPALAAKYIAFYIRTTGKPPAA